MAEAPNAAAGVHASDPLHRGTALAGRVLGVFGGAPGARPAVTVLCLFVASVFEVLGLSMVIPFVASMSGSASGSTSRLAMLGSYLLDATGIPDSTGIILACIAALLALKSLLVLTAMTFVSSSVAQVGLLLRRRLLDALLEAELRYFTGQHPARIANALVNQVARATQAFSFAALSVSEILKLAGILLTASLISGWLLFAILLVALGAAAVLGFILHLRELGYRGTDEISDELLRKTQDGFANLKAIKGMGRVAPFRTVLETSIASLRRTVLRSQIARHTLNAAQDMLMAVALCGGIYICVAWLGMAVGELVILATLFLFMSNGLRILQGHLQSFREFLPAYEACEALLAGARSHAEPETGRRPPTLARAIEFASVSFAHGGRPVLRDASFTIPAGAITVLEGASGAGKTTTADLIIGFHAPQAGKVLVDGVPLSEISAQAWRSAIGYVPQELVLIEGSVADNVTLGDTTLGAEAVWEALETAGIADFVRSLPQGLDTPVGAMGSRLSGGQRQRISLARALVCKPSLLILDEVTSALDSESEHRICETLAALAPPLTIVAITHRPAWTRIASRVLRFADGEVATLEAEESTGLAAASGE